MTLSTRLYYRRQGRRHKPKLQLFSASLIAQSVGRNTNKDIMVILRMECVIMESWTSTETDPIHARRIYPLSLSKTHIPGALMACILGADSVSVRILRRVRKVLSWHAIKTFSSKQMQVSTPSAYIISQHSMYHSTCFLVIFHCPRDPLSFFLY